MTPSDKLSHLNLPFESEIAERVVPARETRAPGRGRMCWLSNESECAELTA